MENLKNESGRTMLEMLGVLGIMGIIMYGAVSGINYGMSTYKVNQVYNDVQDQMQGITDLYSWSRGYVKTNFMQTLCENDIFPQDCDDSKTASTHPFGGDIVATPAPTTYQNCDATLCPSFTLTYKGVQSSACERLREMDWGNIALIKPTEDDIECDGTMEWAWKEDR